jgi:hypothetical protein
MLYLIAYEVNDRTRVRIPPCGSFHLKYADWRMARQTCIS